MKNNLYILAWEERDTNHPSSLRPIIHDPCRRITNQTSIQSCIFSRFLQSYDRNHNYSLRHSNLTLDWERHLYPFLSYPNNPSALSSSQLFFFHFLLFLETSLGNL